MYVLLSASFKEHQVESQGQCITLKPGQFISGKRAISEDTGVNTSKVQRILEYMKADNMLSMEKVGKLFIYSVLEWDNYQLKSDPLNSPLNGPLNGPANKTEKTRKQRAKSSGERKSDPLIDPLTSPLIDPTIIKGKNKYTIMAEEIVAELQRYHNKYKGVPAVTKSKGNTKLIADRLKKTNHSVADVKRMIAVKAEEWKDQTFTGDKPALSYLRVTTLFRPSKFENYMAEAEGVGYVDPVQAKIENCIRVINSNDCSRQEKTKARKLYESIMAEKRGAA